MLVNTKYFGEIELNEDKVITFEDGIIGLEDYKKYAILYDLEDETATTISWLQCLEEPNLALPVIDPNVVKPDYNPIIEDEILNPLGKVKEENLIVLSTLSVPADITKMTINLKAPIIINSDTCKGCQIIVENNDYDVKYSIYDNVQRLKAEKGE